MTSMTELKGLKVGFALTGSFCTLKKAVESIKMLNELGCDITPILSYNVQSLDTKFGTALYWQRAVLAASGKDKSVLTIAEAEPIGPTKMLDILIIAPCSGNSLGKLACGITDTPVLMAAKAHLRNNLPLVVAVSTNDGLAGSFKNIGHLMNYKNVYLVPFGQDSPEKKPNSLTADLSLLPQTMLMALQNRQIQPTLLAAPQ